MKYNYYLPKLRDITLPSAFPLGKFPLNSEGKEEVASSSYKAATQESQYHPPPSLQEEPHWADVQRPNGSHHISPCRPAFLLAPLFPTFPKNSKECHRHQFCCPGSQQCWPVHHVAPQRCSMAPHFPRDPLKTGPRLTALRNQTISNIYRRT